MPVRILVASNDPIERCRLESLCHCFGYEAESVASGEAALARLSASSSPVSLLVLDLEMPAIDGMAVLSRLKESGTKLPVIVETTPTSVQVALGAVRAGARDFVVKPARAERLCIAIGNALHAARLEEEAMFWSRRTSGALSFAELGCESAEMARTVRLAERAAQSTLPVLLEGEPGTGKETFARAIHGASPRRGRAFVAVNCASLGEWDADAVLFGEGAIASGGQRGGGKFAEANGGTLFLDRICELPFDAQASLLGALSQGRVHPAARRPAKSDVRVIAAASRNLFELVNLGRFREDLFYRINIFPISLPPLRARRGDIGALARRFCARFAAEEGKTIRGICAEAEALLCAYDWPGNVRQLENAVFRAVALADGDQLMVAEFPQIAARVKGFGVRIPPVPAPGGTGACREKDIVRIEVRDPNAIALLDECGEACPLGRLEAEAIKFALIHYRGQISAVARKLGIGRSTLYRKLRQHGLLKQPVLEPARKQAAGL